MEDKQETLYLAALEKGQLTKAEAVELLKHCYYRGIGADHYVQEILGRMVKSGLLKRINRGVYVAANPNRRTLKAPIVNPDQTNLFNESEN